MPCLETMPCPPGQLCDPCATASCPECYDCVAACVPAGAGMCDSHDDCEQLGGICVFDWMQCTAGCINDYDCIGGNQVCDPCATSSCPSCKDCMAACMPP